MERRRDDSKHKSFEVLSVFCCFLVILLFLSWGFNSSLLTSPEQKARQYAKILGYSLWQVEVDISRGAAVRSSRENRSVATVNDQEAGSIGRDPWGRSYSYELKRDQQLLFVWSFGQNGIDESGRSLPNFSGDDQGQILDLKMR